MTITNEENSSQVHLLTDKIETNLRVGLNYLSTNQIHHHDNHQQHQQNNPMVNLMNLKSYQSELDNKPIISQTQSNRFIKIDPNTFNKNIHHLRNNPKFKWHSAVHSQKSKEYDSGGGGGGDISSCSSFMPFVDENAENMHFQLSKITDYQNTKKQSPKNNSQNRNNIAQMPPFVRQFGYNRTNLMFNNNPQTTTTTPMPTKYDTIQSLQYLSNNAENENSNSSSVQTSPILNNRFKSNNYNNNINLKSTNVSSSTQSLSRTNISADLCNIFSNCEDSCSSPTTTTNEMTFKNYDLNDEYWLNFDQ